MSDRLKVVFDTNIYISAIVFGGPPQICLEAAHGGKIELCTSKAILLELSNKLREKFGWSEEDIKEVLVGISKFVQVTTPKISVAVIKDNPADNRILEAVLEAQADFLVSGDKKHILPLKTFRKAKIITAAEFLNLL